jgi:hypothetical protein
MSEMYSLAYHPVGSGPICRESCAQLQKVNAMADSAPSYIDNPQQYNLGKPPEFCRSKIDKKNQKHREK